jgi:hypothetical protein
MRVIKDMGLDGVGELHAEAVSKRIDADGNGEITLNG